ncbi:uncharacterized protein LOC133785186 [Humulus lupulus]|uniref:uncharacterized protein LOC133785186 n=1 Tax=Humulus lupulus TaxID=3486 RepID=UPI002B40575C|nr:uncharacterized protein LOC133785186 [Humulus lupulus]
MAIGLTMVKFNDDATRDRVLETGILHFDRKPVIIRPWSSDLSAFRMIRSVPLWIQLQDLGLQYWGIKCLSALVSTLGKPIMVDKFTRERSRVQFARIMVEMEINDNPPRTIQFLNEHGQLLEQGVEYEWLPKKCKTYAGYGHTMADCRKEQKDQGKLKVSPSKSSEMIGRDKGKDDTNVSAVTRKDKGKEGVVISAGISSSKKSSINEEMVAGKIQHITEVSPDENGKIGSKTVWQSPKKVVYKQGKADRRRQRDNSGSVASGKPQSSYFMVLQDQVEVLNLCSENKVGVGALLETKMRGSKVIEMMANRFLNWEYYSSSITEGKILIIWRRAFVKVTVVEETSQFVHCQVRMADLNFPFSVMFVYGRNTLEERKNLWHNLPMSTADGWVILGDVNAVFKANERDGGKPVSKVELVDSSQWLANSQLEVLNETGSFYTWTNNQEGQARIYSKIDHAYANEKWQDLFPTSTAVFKWETISDHCSCTISIQTMEFLGVKLFRFYNF